MKSPIVTLFACAALAQEPAVFPASVSKVYRVRIDKGAGVLESIQATSRQNGAVLTAAGAPGNSSPRQSCFVLILAATSMN